MDEIIIKFNDKDTLYNQVYYYFKNEIESDNIKFKSKMPSIRTLAKVNKVSRTTIEKAYEQLYSEGYIDKVNKSRYIVLDISKTIYTNILKKSININENKKEAKYNLASSGMDLKSFNFNIWKKYLNLALDDKEKLVRYGTKEGEIELRKELSLYIKSSRGIDSNYNNIIIGSNSQVLLNLLCILLKDEVNQIAFEDPGFKNGRVIFESNSFNVIPIKMSDEGINIEELNNSNAKLVFVSPSNQFPLGKIMGIGHRNKLLQWAYNKNALIIEDDYDSEFRYYGNPIPALKGLDYHDSVIYLGSISKIMPPSIRISYLVLPDKLLIKYKRLKKFFTQTSSTLEQIALSKYIKDGEFERQIRRLRKYYNEKRLLFIESLNKYFKDSIKISKHKSGLYVIIDLVTKKTKKELLDNSLKNDILISFVSDYSIYEEEDKDLKQIMLYYSGINIEDIDNVAYLLSKSLLNDKI